MNDWIQQLPRILLCVAAAAALTACGGGGESGKDAHAQASQTATPVEASAVTATARALSDNGTSSTFTAVNVMASGSAAIGVFPEMELQVDGRVVGRATVTSPQVRAYPFVVTPAIAPGARIDVAYVNDAVINGEDRNLVVRAIEIDGQTLRATAPGVVYDLGAVDDIDVIPGRAEMNWNGALRFAVPRTEFVYHDEARDLTFDAQQLQVSSQGDTFLTWHATHKTAEGVIDGTDVNVIQRDASTQAWRRTTIANVPFPNAGGGFVYNLKIMALPQGDMVVCWDAVDISGYDTFNKPPQVYFSRYNAAQNQWSTPQAIPGDYAIYRSNGGWALLPAGDGRLLMLWQTTETRGLYARFYSSVDDTWSVPQDLQAVQLKPGSHMISWLVDSSFNRSGTGMVQISGTAAYYDAAHQIWSAATFVPPESSNADYRSSNKPFAVDEDGNVFAALINHYQPTKLRLSKWSAQTRQIEWTQVVEPVASPYVLTRLDLHADGGLLTWVDQVAHDDPFLSFVQLSKEGLIQGQRQRGPVLGGNPAGDPLAVKYGFNLKTRMTAAGKTYAMWSQFQCTSPEGLTSIDADCQTVFQFSTFLPGQGWSTPQSIPAQAHPGYGEIPFEVNPSGAAALAILDRVVTGGFSDDFRNQIDVRVMALD